MPKRRRSARIQINEETKADDNYDVGDDGRASSSGDGDKSKRARKKQKEKKQTSAATATPLSCCLSKIGDAHTTLFPTLKDKMKKSGVGILREPTLQFLAMSAAGFIHDVLHDNDDQPVLQSVDDLKFRIASDERFNSVLAGVLDNDDGTVLDGKSAAKILQQYKNRTNGVAAAPKKHIAAVLDGTDTNLDGVDLTESSSLLDATSNQTTSGEIEVDDEEYD